MISIQPFANTLRLAGTLITMLLLSACQPASHQPIDNKDTTLRLGPPEKIAQVRAIDFNQVRPVVRLNQNTVVNMQSVGNSQWTGTINVQANASYVVQIEWIETIDSRDLALAQWENQVDVRSEATSVIINASDYNYNLDFDGDSVSNLDERQNNTDPFTAPSQNASSQQNNADDDNQSSDSNNTSDIDNSSNANSNNENQQNSTNTSASNDNVNAHNQVHVVIPRISNGSMPLIDGVGAELNNAGVLINEWSGAVQFDENGNPLSLSNLMIDINADSTNGSALRSWAAMHDGASLYILVLSDDVGARKSDSLQSWNDDSIELFIDANNSKLNTWGDADDFHVLIPLLKQNTSDANEHTNGRLSFGPGSSRSELDVQFYTGPGIGPDGIRVKKWEQDVYEIKIDLAKAGISVGVPFGFELQLNDDDDGGARDSKWGWYHPARVTQDTDTTYLNPSVMGTVLLAPR